jgi:hypothetical protein
MTWMQLKSVQVLGDRCLTPWRWQCPWRCWALTYIQNCTFKSLGVHLPRYRRRRRRHLIMTHTSFSSLSLTTHLRLYIMRADSADRPMPYYLQTLQVLPGYEHIPHRAPRVWTYNPRAARCKFLACVVFGHSKH